MSRMSFTDIAQTIAAYLAIPAVLLYPVGLFALFTQFYGYFSFEFYTAWIAASLANRMMVIGVGATILIVPLIGSVALTWLVSQLLCSHSDREGWGSLRRWHGLAAKLVLVSALAFVLYVLWSRILIAGRVSCSAIVGRRYLEPPVEAMRHQLNLYPDSFWPSVIFVFGGLIGGMLILLAYRKYREIVYQDEGVYPETGYNGIWFFSNGITQGLLLSGLVVAYCTGIVASLLLVGLMPAFMPYMTYGDSLEDPVDHENRYLSHTEGRWYVIHRYRNKNDDRWYGLLALSEEYVSNTRVVPLSKFNPRTAPLPWLQDADQIWCDAPPPPPSK
jgi:hypothetical protein